MSYENATIEAMLPDNTIEIIDLDGMDTLSDLMDHIRELIDSKDDEPLEDDEILELIPLSSPTGFAVHLFVQNAFTGVWVTAEKFDDILSTWSNETDDDRRQAMGEYLEDMGADSLDDFDEAYQGEFSDGAAFAEHTAEELGEIPKDLPSWIVIDWEQSWKGGLRFDYHITDSGHVFRNL